MKNVVISTALFFALITFMVYSNKQLYKFCGSVVTSCEHLEEKLKNDEWEDSYDEAYKLLEKIKNDAPGISVYINHADMDLVSNEVYKLTQYVKQLDKSESLASVHSIKHQVDNIMKIQELSIQNIF